MFYITTEKKNITVKQSETMTHCVKMRIISLGKNLSLSYINALGIKTNQPSHFHYSIIKMHLKLSQTNPLKCWK